MANTIYPAEPSLTGVTSTAVTILTTSTLSVIATTAQGVLNFNKLIVQFQSISSTLSSIEFVAGANYSKHDVALPSAIAIPTDESVITVGGKFFESARFQTAADYVQFYNTGGSVYATAFMLP
jgi:hypothetical protein